MNRRELLLTGSAGIGIFAGCSSSPERFRSGEHHPDDTDDGDSVGNAGSKFRNSLKIDARIPEGTITAGELLEVDVTVKNEGGSIRTVDVTLALDGVVETNETVQVPAGDEVSVSLSTTITTLEPKSVTINGEHVRDIFPTQPNLDEFHVAVDGADTNVGSVAAPLATIQEAIDRATPGDIVYVHFGEYYQHPSTVRAGHADKPITITGPADAILRGSLSVMHSHIHIRGLTFDGLLDPQRPDELSSYAAHNVALNPNREGFTGYIEDIVVKPYAVGNTRSSCVDCKYANHVEIGEFEVTGPAGLVHLVGEEPGHNGEIIYIGIPFTKWLDHEDRPPEEHLFLDEFPVDESNNYHVHHIKHTAGHPHTELVDAKEGTYDILIEYCTDSGGSGYYRHEGHRPSDEGSINLGGTNVIVRWNIIEDGHGAGIIVGNWDLIDEMDDLVGFPDDRYPGTRNSVYGNRIIDNVGLAMMYRTIWHGTSFDNGPDVQKTVCGNEYSGETMGDPGRECGDSVPMTDVIGHLGGDSPWNN